MKGSNSIEPGITQMKRYGLTEEADRITSRRWARSSALQVPCLRCCTSQTTEPFIVAISLRKRLFSRLLPAKKEQNHSGARSMRRWNAWVE